MSKNNNDASNDNYWMPGGSNLFAKIGGLD